MPNTHQFAPPRDIHESIALTTATDAGNTDGDSLDISNTEFDLMIVVYSTAASASDTLDFVVQESEDDTTFTNVDAAELVNARGEATAFTQVTDAGASYQRLYLKTETLNRYIRVRATAAGASAVSITFGASIVYFYKYSEDNTA